MLHDKGLSLSSNCHQIKLLHLSRRVSTIYTHTLFCEARECVWEFLQRICNDTRVFQPDSNWNIQKKNVFNLVGGSGSRPQRQQQAASTKSKTAKVFHHPSSKLANTSIFWHTRGDFFSSFVSNHFTWLACGHGPSEQTNLGTRPKCRHYASCNALNKS